MRREESKRVGGTYAWRVDPMGDYIVEVAFQRCRSQGGAFRGDETFGKLATVRDSCRQGTSTSAHEVIMGVVPSNRFS